MLARSPIFRATSRPQLLMGGERTLVLSLLMLSALLVFSASNIPAAVLGLAFFTGGLWALRRMARSDPDMSRVYVRHVRYAAHYPARAETWRRM